MHITHIWHAFYPVVRMHGSGARAWGWQQELLLLDLIPTGKCFCLLLAGLLIPVSLEVLVLKEGVLLAFDCVDHNKLWKIFKVMGISEHFTCLLRNLYMGIGDTKIGYQILRSWWDSESISRNERGLPLA